MAHFRKTLTGLTRVSFKASDKKKKKSFLPQPFPSKAAMTGVGVYRAARTCTERFKQAQQQASISFLILCTTPPTHPHPWCSGN